MPVPNLSTALRLNNLTTTGSSAIVQYGGADWEAPKAGFIMVVCDGAVDIAAGSAPTAGATAGVHVPANTPREFSVLAGDKLAVINAA